jgi:hypothetical protein
MRSDGAGHADGGTVRRLLTAEGRELVSPGIRVCAEEAGALAHAFGLLLGQQLVGQRRGLQPDPVAAQPQPVTGALEPQGRRKTGHGRTPGREGNKGGGKNQYPVTYGWKAVGTGLAATGIRARRPTGVAVLSIRP